MRSFSLIVFFLFLISGCAFVDQRVTLTYSPINAAKGGHGDLFIVKSIDRLANTKKDNSLVIGNVKDPGYLGGFGTWKTADVLTDDNVADWVTSAYITELNYAGYNVKAVNVFPDNLTKGIQITLNELFVNQDMGLTSIGAITDLKFTIDLYRDNKKIATLDVAAKGDRRGIYVEAKSKGLSLKKALNSAIEQSVPKIIDMLN